MEIPIRHILLDCEIPAYLHENSKFILEGLRKILRQDSNKLKCNETLSAVLLVEKSELNMSFYKAWEKERLQNYLEIFGDDILTFFDQNSTPKKWNKVWANIDDSKKK